MANTIDTQEDISSLFTIKCLVIPVGRVPPEKMAEFSAAISEAGRVLEVAHLTFQSAYKEPAFKSHTWKKSKLRLQFSQRRTVNMAWDELAPHNKVMAVICVCHCPSEPDLAVPYSEFAEIKRKLSIEGGPYRFRCFAFEPTHALHAASDERADFVVFPNEDSERLGFYMQTYISDLASSLLACFEKLIKTMPSKRRLRTPLESSDGKESSKFRNKRLRAGRRSKHIADHCLLAGSPVDAQAHYTTAQDACKSNDDWVWYAGVLEGQASAIVALQRENADVPEKWSEKVCELYDQAMQAYAKVPYTSVLGMRAGFKLAHYQMAHGRKAQAAAALQRVWELRGMLKPLDQIAVTVEVAVLCSSMGLMRKFAFYLQQAAALCGEKRDHTRSQGLLQLCAPVYRMGGLSSALAAMNAEANSSMQEGQECTRSHGPTWHADSPPACTGGSNKQNQPQPQPQSQPQPQPQRQEPDAPAPSTLCLARRRERGLGPERWSALQQGVAERLMATAKRAKNPRLTAMCAAHLLRALHPLLPPHRQEALVHDLLAATANLPINTRVPMEGAVRLVYVRPLSLPQALLPRQALGLRGPWRGGNSNDNDLRSSNEHARRHSDDGESISEGGEGDDVFFFNPAEDNNADGDAQALRAVSYVCGEEFRVECILSNPLHVPVEIQSLTLSAPGSACVQAHSESFTLPPHTLNRRVLLRATPLREGSFRIAGVQVRAFNSACEHKVDVRGVGTRGGLPDLSTAAAVTSGGRSVNISRSGGGDEGTSRSAISDEVGTDLAQCDHVPVCAAMPRAELTFEGPAQLLLGEEATGLRLVLRNVGNRPIGSVALTLRESYAQGSAQAQNAYYTLAELSASESMRLQRQRNSDLAGSVQWDPQQLWSQLPLQPGECLTVPLSVGATAAVCGCDATLRYAEEEHGAALMRELSLRPRWTVRDGLRLLGARILPYVPPLGATAGLSSSSSTAGAALLPAPSIGGGHCTLLLELSNSTGCTFRLRAVVDGDRQRAAHVDKRGSARVMLLLRRPALGAADEQALRALAEQWSALPASDPRRQRLLRGDEYARLHDRLAARVKLCWRSSDGTNGELRGLSLSPAQLVKLLPEPVELTFELAGDARPAAAAAGCVGGSPIFVARSPLDRGRSASTVSLSLGRSPSFRASRTGSRAGALDSNSAPTTLHLDRYPVGDFRPLVACVTNRTTRPLQLALSVQPYQETVNGGLDTALEHKLLWTGCLDCELPVLEPGETHHHEVGLCFVSAGRFHFLATCDESGHKQCTQTVVIDAYARPNP